ncbi:hypothetical protein GCM10022403_046330 [Streptomyces coacervatus]|uniref:Oxidoreductase n=1 Tax=Streptomyces coacervatus TaxID=647381 RepID=A0ABP7I0U7_9ACTN|nr:hypothetical protein [Streptomyces coacervatus]MDF2269486.1 hypothetical protein [Streptomyces coacervatus]
MTVTVSGLLPRTAYDVAIVGAGVVGRATAFRPGHHLGLRGVLLGALDDVGQGVLQAGTALFDRPVAKKAGPA